MIKRIVAIAFIYLCTVLGWTILGSTMLVRTHSQDSKLKDAVSQLWGTTQRQRAPTSHYDLVTQDTVQITRDGKSLTEVRDVYTPAFLPLDASDIRAALSLEYRQKGLLWYSTYRVRFTGAYTMTNPTDKPRDFLFMFALPAREAVYNNFKVEIDGREKTDIEVNDGKISLALQIEPAKARKIRVSYESQGMDEWSYDFGSNVSQIRNFSLSLETDFDKIDFPLRSISPTRKEKLADGWRLSWTYANILSDVEIGMSLPRKLNPGPWVSNVTYAAPISLFLFFFLLFIFTTLRRLRFHPMNYFFVAAGFFSFHLLLAYLIDHLSIHASFIICSLVSVGLVISYLRLVVGLRYALIEAGLSQFVYLVLFSYTFFFEGYTGLAITVLSIVTLFIVMQCTGKVDWEEIFSNREKAV